MLYLYAKPKVWPKTEEPIDPQAIAVHGKAAEAFAEDVAQDEAHFVSLIYRDLLAGWEKSPSPHIRKHAEAIHRCSAL